MGKTNFNSKRFKPASQLTEEELQQRLFWLITLIVITTVGLIGSVLFFGPNIGALFGLISVHRNEKEKDTISPNPPNFLNIPEYVKETTVSIKGFSEGGSTVKLFVNGPEKSSTAADADGAFNFGIIDLIKGRNTIFAKSVDAYGNESEKSETIIVTVDTDAPEITLDNLKNGSVVRNLDKRLLVKGKVNEKASIRVNGRLAILRPDLTFEVLLGVEEGSVEIKIEAVDEAQNKKEEKLFITYEKRSP